MSVDFAALLFDGGVGDRKVDRDPLTVGIDPEQIDIVVERVVRASPPILKNSSKFDRVQLNRPIVSLRWLDGLFGAAVHLPIVFEQAVAELIGIDRPACGELRGQRT